MRKVTLNNQEIEIRFNLATQLSYEELSGKAFNASEILPREGDDKQSKDLMNLAIACLIANESPVGADYMLKEASYKESQELIVAVVKEMLTWLGVPSIAEEHVPEAESPTDSEDAQENLPND